MSIKRKIAQRKKRRKLRIKKKFVGHDLPRISVFRSAKHIYGQVIDDASGKTVVSGSTLDIKKLSGNKTSVAHQVGKELGKRALEKNVSQVVFDRGAFLFHGRVKAFAEGLRESGLKI